MKLLTVQEYNEQVKQFYPQDWAQIHKANGFVATDEKFNYTYWGKTKKSAINKWDKPLK